MLAVVTYHHQFKFDRLRTMDIKNKVIAVTGAARGLGFAMAKLLSEKGSLIALIDLDIEATNNAVKELPNAKGYACNVAQEHEVVQTFSQIKEDFGHLDGLINNAGILKDGLMVKTNDDEVQKLPLSQWQAVIDVNLTGVFLCGREAAASMVEQGSGGVIINISSVSRAGNFGQTNYSAAKAGVAAMTVTWAKELARYGIRSAGIAPGFVETEMTDLMPEEAFNKVANLIPLGRMGRVDEIAHTAAYIFENDYVSGRIIDVDGGIRV